MAAAAEADDRYGSRNRRRDSGNTVLHDDAVLWRRAETLRGEQEQVGGGLAVSDLEALNTCGSKKGSRPVTASLWRTRSRRPFEATQRGVGNAARRSVTPAIGNNSRSKAVAERTAKVSKNVSGSARPNQTSTACERVVRLLAKAERDGLIDRRRKISRV